MKTTQHKRKMKEIASKMTVKLEKVIFEELDKVTKEKDEELKKVIKEKDEELKKLKEEMNEELKKAKEEMNEKLEKAMDDIYKELNKMNKRMDKIYKKMEKDRCDFEVLENTNTALIKERQSNDELHEAKIELIRVYLFLIVFWIVLICFVGFTFFFFSAGIESCIG